MLGRLTVDLGSDVETIRQVVERLSADQRHGLRPLPGPLPSVPAIASAFEGLELDSRDRELLLGVAVALDDSLAPLLDLDGRSPLEITSGPIGEHLLVHAGHVRFVDPRLSVWIRATSSAATATRVHERLSAILRRRGDHVGADWHHARGSLERDPATAPQLIRIARRLIGAGLPERAFLLAREAAAHAVEGHRDEAVLVAGSSAVAAGYAAEGAAWLARLFPGGTASCRRRGLGGLFVAHALMTGTVPDVDPRALRPLGDVDDWGQWTRAAALAALMCAERQDRRGMRVWLDEVRQGAARIGVERDLGDQVVALSWLIAGERDVDGPRGSRSVSGAILDALRAAMGGDLDRGCACWREMIPRFSRSTIRSSPSTSAPRWCRRTVSWSRCFCSRGAVISVRRGTGCSRPRSSFPSRCPSQGWGWCSPAASISSSSANSAPYPARSPTRCHRACGSTFSSIEGSGSTSPARSMTRWRASASGPISEE
ncbi:hypothetical protein [Microbacterium sp. Se63.02b]|uniref:hypothetical protein n=1 Tax=Microbacterium sp. Se63.02b TaxID=2709304 RepID=UPI001604C952|nr:hypothetical protein [Microbacterium sp. Se63.02b]QNA92419.1 hypothetical protein G4G29_08645 [Microbacterium sp. Se63.02b]